MCTCNKVVQFVAASSLVLKHLPRIYDVQIHTATVVCCVVLWPPQFPHCHCTAAQQPHQSTRTGSTKNIYQCQFREFCCCWILTVTPSHTFTASADLNRCCGCYPYRLSKVQFYSANLASFYSANVKAATQ